MRALKTFSLGFIGGGIFGLMITVTALAVVSMVRFPASNQDLGSKEAIMNRNNTGLVLLDRNGGALASFYQAHRARRIPLDQIPPITRQAVLAAEDKGFYSHPGFSVTAIAGSLIANLRHDTAAYGGSTITQQLAKNAFLTPEKSWQRKLQELLLARQLEGRYSKDEILEMYLNSVYFGEGAFGIEDAAQTYFSTPASSLTLQQSALLAGLLAAPSAYSPISGTIGDAMARKDTVLRRMLEARFITPSDEAAARTGTVAIRPSVDTQPAIAPHFALMVKNTLVNRYGEEAIARSGYTVTTTLDPAEQALAEKAVADQVKKLERNKVTNGAAVVMDVRTGEVRAVVGSKDWNDPKDGKFNVATADRQPGSSFKPIVYLSALENDTVTPASILRDLPTTFGGTYRPRNYDLQYRGHVTVRRSLANSLNIPTVLIQQKVGVPASLTMAKRLGITSLDGFSPNDLSLSLGSGTVSPLEMTNAYATFARLGSYLPSTLYSSIRDKYSAEIYQYRPEGHQAVGAAPTYLLTSILSDNAARKEVFGNSLTISRPAAVKTGTTNDYKDSWTIGYTPSLAVGVWIGNNDSTPMDNVAGSLGAAPVWKTIMEGVLSGTPQEVFPRPAGIVEVLICQSTGLLAAEGSRADGEYTKEVFIRGTEPTKQCGSLAEPSPTPSPSVSPLPMSEGTTPAVAPATILHRLPLSPATTIQTQPTSLATPIVIPPLLR